MSTRTLVQLNAKLDRALEFASCAPKGKVVDPQAKQDKKTKKFSLRKKGGC